MYFPEPKYQKTRVFLEIGQKSIARKLTWEGCFMNFHLFLNVHLL
jgi:hypothetical protein